MKSTWILIIVGFGIALGIWIGSHKHTNNESVNSEVISTDAWLENWKAATRVTREEVVIDPELVKRAEEDLENARETFDFVWQFNNASQESK